MGTCTISIPRSTRASRVLHGERSKRLASPRNTNPGKPGVKPKAPPGNPRHGAVRGHQTRTNPSRRFWHVCVAAQRFRFAHARGSRDTMRCMSCVVFQHVMHGFPGVAIWLSCMHTSHWAPAPAGWQTCLRAFLCTASAPMYVYTLLPCAVGHLLVLTSDARGC